MAEVNAVVLTSSVVDLLELVVVTCRVIFNESDLAIANRCVEILRKAYPDARVVRIGLPSAKGQLEVWLPKVRPAGGQ